MSLESSAIASLDRARARKRPDAKHEAVWESLGLTLAGDVPHANTANAARVLRSHEQFAGKIGLDTFSSEVMGPNGAWSDVDTAKATIFMQEAIGIPKMSVQVVSTAVPVVAAENAKSSAQGWLECLQWDGQERLDWLLPCGFGAEDSPYTRAVSKCFLIGMVARAYVPGVKVDTMPVLEGAQGCGKSTGLRSLVGDRWFAEMSESPNNKDFYLVMKGKMLLEIAELDAFRRADLTAVKRVMTATSDRYRAPYASRPADHPRQSVFAGTTNRDDWNRDETGARRFWPIRCGEVSIPWITASREQLFAESVTRFKAGESWWDVPDADARVEQEARAEGDPWDEVVERWLDQKSQATVAAVLEHGIGMDPGQFTKAAQMRVGAVLRRMKWSRVKRRVEGTPTWMWERDMPESSHQSVNVPTRNSEVGT